MTLPEDETGAASPPPTRLLTWIAWIGAVLSFALPIIGWTEGWRYGDMTVPLRMGVIGLVMGVLAYWRLGRDVIIVAIVGNALTTAFVLLMWIAAERS